MKHLKTMLLCMVFILCSISVPVLAQQERTPESYAAYLKSTFGNNSETSYVDGDVYTASGTVTLNKKLILNGSVTMLKSAKFQGNESNIQKGLIKEDSLSFDYTLPDFPTSPEISNHEKSLVISKPYVIDKDTHFDSLNIKNTLTFDVSKGDITLVVDYLDSSPTANLVLQGTGGTVTVFVKNTASLLRGSYNEGGMYDQLFMHFESDNVSFYNANVCATVTATNDASLVKGTHFKGVFTMGGTKLTVADTSMKQIINGYLIAPDAQMQLHNNTEVTGRVVARKLGMGGNSKLIYGTLEKEFSPNITGSDAQPEKPVTPETPTVPTEPENPSVDVPAAPSEDETELFSVLKYDVQSDTFQMGTMKIKQHTPSGYPDIHYTVLDETSFIANSDAPIENLMQKAKKLCETADMIFEMRSEEINLSRFGRVDSNAYRYASLTISPYVNPYLEMNGFNGNELWLVWGNRAGNTETVFIAE